MVLVNQFQDILDVTNKSGALSLPAFKPNNLEVEFSDSDDFTTVYSGKEPILPFAESEVFSAKISNWRRLTAVHEDCKPVYEITFDVKGSNFKWKPGDTIGIIPHNAKEEVDTIIEHLKLSSQADLAYTLSVDVSQKGAKIPPHVPVKSTLRHVLTHLVDLRSVIKKLFLLALSRHTKDEDERKILEYLCSKEGSEMYQTHILEKNLCVVDLFNIFQSCQPPVEILLTHLPRLLPRPYSIVNSMHKDPNLKICFSVMNIGNNRKGLTTSWLEVILNEDKLENKLKNMNINEQSGKNLIPIYLRKNMSGFSLPEDLETPLILISPGTGVAPFIGFLEERQYKKETDGDVKLGDAWLFFGCRNPKLDFIYEAEINEFIEDGSLSKLSTAFSRIENNGIKYVQDAVIENAASIVDFIKNGGCIFVCGDQKTMAVQVKEAIVSCLVKCGDTVDVAEKIVADMQKQNRYVIDIWS